MKSAIVFALAIVPALTGILEAAEPLGPLQVATTLRESLPPEPAAKKPAGPPIMLVVRIYEMDTKKLGPDIDFRPQKEVRTTVNAQFEAFRKAGFVRVLAEPHLVTQGGRPATCLLGGEVPVLIPAGRETVAIDWLEFGTRIEVTPRRVKQGRIQIRIAAEFTRRAEHGLTSEDHTNPVVVGRLIRTGATLGPKDIVVLNDHDAQESDDPEKVIFMTVELADAGVEAALLQFDGQAAEEELPAPPRDLPARAVPNRSGPSVEPPIPTGGQPADLPGEVGTGGVPEEGSTASPRNARPARKNSAASSKASFFLKPGKTQLELTRGTWRSLTIPSKDFAYGSSLLVESPDDGAVSISGRNLTPFEDGPAKTESFEAGEAGEKYAADIWTIKALKPGIATIRLIDDDDQEYEIEVTVKGDTRHLDAMLARFHPKAKIEAVEVADSSVILQGEVSSDEEATQVEELAKQLYATVLLRLKTRPIPETEGADTGDEGDPYSSGTGASFGEFPARESTIPTVRPGETAILSSGSTPDVVDGGDGPAAVWKAANLVADTVASGYRAAPATPAIGTTQVRFLNSGFISMQTPAEPGHFKKVQSWSTQQVLIRGSGQPYMMRFQAHSENIPQGSQTRFQFRTTQFRDDVWVNGVLLTTVGNAKTRYFLQHFPVDLVLQDHEIVSAAQGKLVTRFVVMKDLNHVPIAIMEGATEELKESFTGPNSFAEAIAESRKQGELLAVLVLGQESMLQRGFALPGSSARDGWSSGEDSAPSADLPDPNRQNAIFDNPSRLNKTVDDEDNTTDRWEIQQPAGSVSKEMRQLRQEVRSLREQLGKLVEVLSRENRTKPQVKHPVPIPVESIPEPIGRGSDGFSQDDGPRSENSTPVPFPNSDGTRDKTLPPPTRLFEVDSSSTSTVKPELPIEATPANPRSAPGLDGDSTAPVRKPRIKPSSNPLDGDDIPVDSESIPPPETSPAPAEKIPTPST